MMKSKIAQYKAGYRAEREAREILESWGLLVVRSAKSGGPFDLVAIDKKKIMLVQVKLCPRGKVPPYGTLRKELASVAVPPNCVKQIWIKEKRRGFHFLPV